MSADHFTCLFLQQDSEKKITHSFETLANDRLPEGDVTVAVKYSTLNYKDGMIINGLGRLVRDYPHVPGIDFCGIVEESSSPNYKLGDEVNAIEEFTAGARALEEIVIQKPEVHRIHDELATVYQHLSLLYFDRGEKETGRQAFEKALQHWDCV